MQDEVFIERFEKLVSIGLKFLSPSRSGIVIASCIKCFIILTFILDVSMVVAIIAYWFDHKNEKSFADITELGLLLVTFTRQSAYVVLIILRRDEAKSMILKVVEDRKTRDGAQRKLTIRYCRTEFKMFVGFSAEVAFNMLFLHIGYVFVFSNFQLPLKLAFVPLEGFRCFWLLNYLYHVFVSVLATTFLLFYWPMILIVMNHSCWVADSAISLIKSLENVSSQKNLVLYLSELEVATKKVNESMLDIIQWQKRAQKLLRFDFLLEFSTLSFLICFSAITISTKVSSIDVMELIVCALQLLIYCWMGSRVENRFQMLATAIYDVKWERMKLKKQKDVKLMLVMAQNLRGFNSFFNKVDMETFQQILKFSFSLLAFLRTMN